MVNVSGGDTYNPLDGEVVDLPPGVGPEELPVLSAHLFGGHGSDVNRRRQQLDVERDGGGPDDDSQTGRVVSHQQQTPRWGAHSKDH